ncbi:MAG: biopolymer transporter ExbD [Candidatus Latescibacterota bacterium]|nr:MAG: biopolymer transporter ExbD [Candidatus Latescibacterota bacterium]
MKFQRESKIENKVPTSSMADIAFLLLIFFMTTTIFKMEDGLQITLPRAETASKQEREKIIRVWIDPVGHISIQDKLIELQSIKDVMIATMQDNPALIVAFNADHRTPNGVISDVMDQLKEANAVRVSFTADKQKAGEV